MFPAIDQHDSLDRGFAGSIEPPEQLRPESTFPGRDTASAGATHPCPHLREVAPKSQTY